MSKEINDLNKEVKDSTTVDLV